MKTNALFAILAVAAEARFEDVKSYETFDATSCVTGSAFAKADAVYPDSLTMKVPFHGEDLELNVSADRSIFADDWSLVDDSGKVLSTDKEAWMCHYTGSVTGKKGSTVTISVCNEGGISQGLLKRTISTPRFNPWVRPARCRALAAILFMTWKILSSVTTFSMVSPPWSPRWDATIPTA